MPPPLMAGRAKVGDLACEKSKLPSYTESMAGNDVRRGPGGGPGRAMPQPEMTKLEKRRAELLSNAAAEARERKARRSATPPESVTPTNVHAILPQHKPPRNITQPTVPRYPSNARRFPGNAGRNVDFGYGRPDVDPFMRTIREILADKVRAKPRSKILVA